MVLEVFHNLTSSNIVGDTEDVIFIDDAGLFYVGKFTIPDWKETYYLEDLQEVLSPSFENFDDALSWYNEGGL